MRLVAGRQPFGRPVPGRRPVQRPHRHAPETLRHGELCEAVGVVECEHLADDVVLEQEHHVGVASGAERDGGHAGARRDGGQHVGDVVEHIAKVYDADPTIVLELSSVRHGEPSLLVGNNQKLKDLGWVNSSSFFDTLSR